MVNSTTKVSYPNFTGFLFVVRSLKITVLIYVEVNGTAVSEVLKYAVKRTGNSTTRQQIAAKISLVLLGQFLL